MLRLADSGREEGRADHARLDQRGVDAEGLDLRGERLVEALDPPFRGVVEREAGERHQATHAGELQDAAPTLFAQIRYDRAGQLDGRGQVGGDRVVDVGVGEFLGRAQDPVAGVGDHDVDPTELGEYRHAR